MKTDTSSPVIRIFVVDDHPIVRKSLADMFNSTPGLCTVGDAASPAEAIERIGKAAPDLAVVDLELNGASGFDLIGNLRRLHPALRILVLSMHDEQRKAQRALRAGAHGYVMKTAGADEILQAVRRVRAGELVVSEAVHQQLVANAAGQGTGSDEPEQLLSDRELQVFEDLGRGLTPAQTAQALGVSVKTVGTYLTRIKEKYGLAHIRDLARKAYDWIKGHE